MIDCDIAFENDIRDLIIDICEVMHRRGYTTVSIGAMMRLLGTAPERAAAHDHEYFALDEGFAQVLESKKALQSLQVPPGTVLH